MHCPCLLAKVDKSSTCHQNFKQEFQWTDVSEKKTPNKPKTPKLAHGQVFHMKGNREKNSQNYRLMETRNGKSIKSSRLFLCQFRIILYGTGWFKSPKQETSYQYLRRWFTTQDTSQYFWHLDWIPRLRTTYCPFTSWTSSPPVFPSHLHERTWSIEPFSIRNVGVFFMSICRVISLPGVLSKMR